jgi:hypothetical protein
VIRVLSRTAPGQYILLFDSPDAWDFGGLACDIELHDLDGDSQREVTVRLRANRGSDAWAFGWTGSVLLNLTPTVTEGDRERSRLYAPGVFDLYHDGSLQFISTGTSEFPADGQPAAAPDTIYRLGATGTYVREKDILVAGKYIAGIDPRVNVDHFSLVADSVGPFTIRLVNGKRDGTSRVTSGSILLNGVQVIGPAQLHGQAEVVIVSVPSLPVTNIIKAQLTGPAGTYVGITIEDSTLRP